MMKCPTCGREFGELKKYDYRNCKCGEQLMCMPEGKKLKIVTLSKNKGEK